MLTAVMPNTLRMDSFPFITYRKFLELMPDQDVFNLLVCNQKRSGFKGDN